MGNGLKLADLHDQTPREVGHVKAHQRLGCGDVGCDQSHEEG